MCAGAIYWAGIGASPLFLCLPFSPSVPSPCRQSSLSRGLSLEVSLSLCPCFVHLLPLCSSDALKDLPIVASSSQQKRERERERAREREEREREEKTRLSREVLSPPQSLYRACGLCLAGGGAVHHDGARESRQSHPAAPLSLCLQSRGRSAACCCGWAR